MRHNIKVAVFGAFALAGFATVSAAEAPVKTPPSSAACAVEDFSSFHYAGNDCGDTWRLFDNIPFMKQYGVTLDGWLNGGFTYNPDHPRTSFNGPDGFSDRDRFQFNQGYLSLERTAPKGNQGWFLGGRVDEFYGSDFLFATAAGLDGTRRGNAPTWHDSSDFYYGRSLPQIYVEGDYNDLQVKAGHFYTIIGHESVMAKENFFETHTYSYIYGQPKTDSGVLVSKPFNNWKLTAGLVDGWDQYTANDTQGERNFNNFIGGISYADSRFGAALNAQIGNNADFNAPGTLPYSRRTLLNFVGSANITGNLNYLLDAQWGEQSQTLGFNALNSSEARWGGVNQQLIYAFNNQWSFGARYEYFDDPQGYLVTGLRPGTATSIGNTDARFRFPGSFSDASLGVNFKPLGNLTIRGEAREDWYNGQPGFVAPAVPGAPPNQPYGNNNSNHQFLFGLDAVLQF